MAVRLTNTHLSQSYKLSAPAGQSGKRTTFVLSTLFKSTRCKHLHLVYKYQFARRNGLRQRPDAVELVPFRFHSRRAQRQACWSAVAADIAVVDVCVHVQVIGVGGGGSNAVKRMMESEIQGVEFWSLNTDVQVCNHVTLRTMGETPSVWLNYYVRHFLLYSYDSG